MKTVSAALQTHFGQATTTLAVLWKVTRQDGTVLGFTTLDKNVVYNSVTYLASSGFLPTANESKSDMSVDSLEVTGFLDNAVIKEADIRNGVYDYATVEQRVINWTDLTQGDVILRKGIIGNVKMINGLFTAEVRGLSQYLSTMIGSLFGPLCRAELFSDPASNNIDPGSKWLCHVKESDYIQSGSVGSAPDALTIVPSLTNTYGLPTFVASCGFNRLTGNQGTGNLGGVGFTTGNIVVITVECYRVVTDAITVADTNGNVWHKVPNTFVTNNHNPSDPDFGSFSQQIWYSIITNGGAGVTITATFPITVNYPAIYGCEVGNASGIDQSTSATGNGVPSSGSITTVATKTLVYGSVYDDGGGSSAPGSGWTNIQHQFNQYLNEYRIAASNGTFAATTNQAGAVQFTAAIVAIAGAIISSTGLLQVGSTTPTAAAPFNWFTDGEITFTSGLNNGFKFEIKSWDGTSLGLFLPMPYPPAPGDTFTIVPGCDKTPTVSGCLKFQGYDSNQNIVAVTNIKNFRGEPFIPGTDLTLNYPDAT